MSNTKYMYTTKCQEISGFGGSYERECRKMVIRGMEWFDKHPKTNPKFTELEDVYGIITAKTPSAKALMKYMVEDIDCTGAMFTHVYITYYMPRNWVGTII